MAFERARRPRRFRKKKPLRRLAKRAQHRKSAAAQGRQISTLARHLSTLKETVKADTTGPVYYWQQINAPLKTIDTSNYNVIVPLTCGVSQNPASGHTPLTNLLAVSTPADPSPPQTVGWEPIFQSRDMRPYNTASIHVPPWCKLYKAHHKLRFYAGTTQEPTTLTVSVVRINTRGPIENIKGIASRLDGPDGFGPNPADHPDNSFIAKNLDYASTDGLHFPGATLGDGGVVVPGIPTTNANGATNIKWNSAMYKVVYQKSFTLGSAPNPLSADVLSNKLQQQAASPAQMAPDHNQFHEECSFSINYGGLKLSACPPNEEGNLALDPQAVTDMQYANIPPQHKHWLVITSSNPQIGASQYAPYMQMSSYVSARVPV